MCTSISTDVAESKSHLWTSTKNEINKWFYYARFNEINDWPRIYTWNFMFGRYKLLEICVYLATFIDICYRIKIIMWRFKNGIVILLQLYVYVTIKGWNLCYSYKSKTNGLYMSTLCNTINPSSIKKAPVGNTWLLNHVICLIIFYGFIHKDDFYLTINSYVQYPLKRNSHFWVGVSVVYIFLKFGVLGKNILILV